MSGLERRLEALERRVAPPRPEEVPGVFAFTHVLPEEDRRTLLDLHETGGPYEDEDTALSRATPSQLAAYRRYDSLRDLPLATLQELEARLTEDPEYLSSYLQAVNNFWQASEEHGRDTFESRQAARAFQRERQALHRDLEGIER